MYPEGDGLDAIRGIAFALALVAAVAVILVFAV